MDLSRIRRDPTRFGRLIEACYGDDEQARSVIRLIAIGRSR